MSYTIALRTSKVCIVCTHDLQNAGKERPGSRKATAGGGGGGSGTFASKARRTCCCRRPCSGLRVHIPRFGRQAAGLLSSPSVLHSTSATLLKHRWGLLLQDTNDNDTCFHCNITTSLGSSLSALVRQGPFTLSQLSALAAQGLLPPAMAVMHPVRGTAPLRSFLDQVKVASGSHETARHCAQNMAALCICLTHLLVNAGAF